MEEQKENKANFDIKEENKECTHQGQNIAFWRGIFNWSQEDLAERMGVTQPEVSRIEKKEELSKKELESLTEIFNLPKEVFFSCNHRANREIIVNHYTFRDQSVNTQNNTYNPLEEVVKAYQSMLSMKDEITDLKVKLAKYENVK